MDKTADTAPSTRSKRDKLKENPNEPVNIGNYKIDKTLGQGTYGKVKLGIHQQTGDKVAIKIIEKANIQSQKQVARIQREIRFLKLLNHPHIVKVYDVFETPEQIFIVMEHIQGGELFDYIVTHKRVKEKEARAFYRMVLSAVDYCHKNSVIHRDLKPENLLLDSDKTIKIIDFGFGNTFKPHALLDTFCGSPFYAAPEMILGKMYEGPEVDMWSLGVILFALLCGHLPFDDENAKELYRKIANGTYTCPAYLSSGAKNLIHSLITVDPKKRATLQDAMNSPWVNEGYTTPILCYLPERPILRDPSVLNKDLIVRLQAFGYTVDDINAAFADEDPTKPHPIRATYFLLQEMLQREEKKLRSSRHASTSQSSPTSVSSSSTALSNNSNPVIESSVASSQQTLPEDNKTSRSTSNKAMNTTATITPPTIITTLDEAGAERTKQLTTDANNAPSSPTIVGASLYSILEDESDSVVKDRAPAPITAANKAQFISMPQVSADKSRRASEPDSHIVKLSLSQTPGANRTSLSPTQTSSSNDEKRGQSSAPVSSSHNNLAPLGSSTSSNNHSRTQSTSESTVASSGTAAGSKSRRFSLVSLAGGNSKRRSSTTGPVIPNSTPSTSSNKPLSSTTTEKAGDRDELRQINGWFLNVSTTSSKTPVEIITEVTRVLRENEVMYTHNGGYLIECRYREHTSSMSSAAASAGGEVLFEIEICKVPRLSLFGLHFKRISGGIWNYKKVCNKLLSQMNL